MLEPVRAYLDHAASTPLDAEVREAVAAALRCPGSPDADHPAGAPAAAMLERARAQVAALIGADPEDVIFASGATEARNLAVKGLLSANRTLGPHAVASSIEHPAVIATLRSRMRDGDPVSFTGVDGFGHIDPGALADAVGPETCMVSIHHAQHEVGTIQDLDTLIDAVRARRDEVRVHVDAAESAGIMPIDVTTIGADAVTISGTDLGAPTAPRSTPVRKRPASALALLTWPVPSRSVLVPPAPAGCSRSGPLSEVARRGCSPSASSRSQRSASTAHPSSIACRDTCRSRFVASPAKASPSRSVRAACASPPVRPAPRMRARPRLRSRQWAATRPGPTRRYL